MNISSIIVKTHPEHYREVWESLEKSGLCDLHFGEEEKGVIIVTIEGETVEEEIAKLAQIEELPHIISAEMHMSYCEEEIEGMLKEMDIKKVVEELNLPKKAEEITYFGSLKGKY
jgi:nitrate reductase NapD